MHAAPPLSTSSSSPSSTSPPAQPAADACVAGKSLVRNTALVGAAALASRVLGFVRDMTMAWLLGNTLAADALALALRLPHVLRRLLGEGTLSMTLTADITRAATLHASAPSSTPAASLAQAMAVRLGLVLGLAVLLGEICALPLAKILAPGQAQHAALMEEAAFLLRLCLPYALTAGLAALGMALLHSLQRFLLPALMPALFNVVVLVFAGVAAYQSLSGASAARLLALGVLCGGMAQWLLQAVAVRRLSTTGLCSAPPAHSASRAWRALSRLPLGVLGAAAPQLAMLGAMMAASWLPAGSLAALYYAERLLELPLGVAGAALGVASLPALAGWAAEGKEKEFASLTQQSLRLSLCCTLPAMTGLLAVAWPLVELLFARGAFDGNAVQATALALMGYAPGLPAYGLTRPLLAACHARQRTRFTAMTGVVAVVLAVAASLAFTLFLPASWAHWALLGPPLGVSLGLWAQSLLLFYRLRFLLGAERPLRLWGPGLWQQMGAALATACAAYAVTLCPLALWLRLPLAVLAGVAVYALLLYLLGNAELQQMRAGLKRSKTAA